MSQFTYKDVMQILNDYPNREFTYAGIASELGLNPQDNAKAVGSAMKPICELGRHDMCVRVTDQNRQHHCKAK